MRFIIVSAILAAAVLTAGARPGGNSNPCRLLPSGDYCVDNAITHCENGYVRSVPFKCSSNCIIKADGPVCESFINEQYSDFCTSRRNGTYCDPSLKTRAVKCAGNQFAGTDDCASTAFCQQNPQLKGTRPGVRCIDMAPVVHEDCADLRDMSYWCDDGIVYHCSLGKRSITEVPTTNQVCAHERHVNSGDGLVLPSKNCHGKPQGYYCATDSHRFYYCPGPRHQDESTIPAQAVPTTCIGLWPFLNTMPALKCTERSIANTPTVHCSIGQ